MSNFNCADNIDGISGSDYVLIKIIGRLKTSSCSNTMEISLKKTKLKAKITDVIQRFFKENF